MRTLISSLLFLLALSSQAQNSITVTENIAYRTDVGKSTVLDLAEPQFGPKTGRPAILIIHGGGHTDGFD